MPDIFAHDFPPAGAEETPAAYGAQEGTAGRAGPSAVPAVKVVADHREVRGGVVEALRARPDVTVTVETLPLGDYLVNDRFLVERKRLPDLVQSVADGRLFRQAIRLAHSDRHPLLVLEGAAHDLDGCRMRREALQGALVSVSVLLGVPVLRSRGPEETARLLVCLARQACRSRVRGVYRDGRKPRGLRALRLHILQGLPGIGREKAERLLAAFGSVEAVMGAGADDLARVPGIGRTLSRRIRLAVGRETS